VKVVLISLEHSQELEIFQVFIDFPSWHAELENQALTLKRVSKAS
jgi:hypothetical protein